MENGVPQLSTKTVSYTHLDVYKRQSLYSLNNERMKSQLAVGY